MQEYPYRWNNSQKRDRSKTRSGSNIKSQYCQGRRNMNISRAHDYSYLLTTMIDKGALSQDIYVFKEVLEGATSLEDQKNILMRVLQNPSISFFGELKMYCRMKQIPMDDITREYIINKAPFGVDHRLRTNNQNWTQNILGTLEFLMKSANRECQIKEMKLEFERWTMLTEAECKDAILDILMELATVFIHKESIFPDVDPKKLGIGKNQVHLFEQYQYLVIIDLLNQANREKISQFYELPLDARMKIDVCQYKWSEHITIRFKNVANVANVNQIKIVSEDNVMQKNKAIPPNLKMLYQYEMENILCEHRVNCLRFDVMKERKYNVIMPIPVLTRKFGEIGSYCIEEDKLKCLCFRRQNGFNPDIKKYVYEDVRTEIVGEPHWYECRVCKAALVKRSHFSEHEEECRRTMELMRQEQKIGSQSQVQIQQSNSDSEDSF